MLQQNNDVFILCAIFCKEQGFFLAKEQGFLLHIDCFFEERQLFGCHAIYLLSKEWRDVFAVVVHYADSSKNIRNYSVRFFFYRSKNYY